MPEKRDFTELDAALTARIESGQGRYSELVEALRAGYSHLVRTRRRRNDRVDGWSRLVDRRLQALRKAGKLAYEQKQWRSHAPGKDETK